MNTLSHLQLLHPQDKSIQSESVEIVIYLETPYDGNKHFSLLSHGHLLPLVMHMSHVKKMS